VVENERVLEREIRDKLEALGIRTGSVSKRDGFVMFIAEKADKRVFVWIRKSPITEKAVKRAMKTIAKYTIDAVLTLSFYEGADYTKIPPQLNLTKVRSVDEAVATIKKLIGGDSIGRWQDSIETT